MINMTLSGNEIKMMYDYVQEHGLSKMYSVGNVIPCDSVGYHRWISTKGEDKKDVADYNLI